MRDPIPRAFPPTCGTSCPCHSDPGTPCTGPVTSDEQHGDLSKSAGNHISLFTAYKPATAAASSRSAHEPYHASCKPEDPPCVCDSEEIYPLIEGTPRVPHKDKPPYNGQPLKEDSFSKAPITRQFQLFDPPLSKQLEVD